MNPERIKVDHEEFADLLDMWGQGQDQSGHYPVHLLEGSFPGPFAHTDDNGAPRLEVSRCERSQDGIGRVTWIPGGVLTSCSADATRADLLEGLGPGRYDLVLRHQKGTVIARTAVTVGDVAEARPSQRIGSLRRKEAAEQAAPRDSAIVAELRAQLAADRKRHEAEVERIQKRAREQIQTERDDRDDAVRRARELGEDEAKRLRAELDYTRDQLARARKLLDEADDERRELRRQVERGGGAGALHNLEAFAEEAQAYQAQLKRAQELLGGQGAPPQKDMGDMVSETLGGLDNLMGKVGMGLTGMRLLTGK